MKLGRALLALSLTWAAPSAVLAADEPEAQTKAETPPTAYEANSASKSFTGTFGGQRVTYTATVEE